MKTVGRRVVKISLAAYIYFKVYTQISIVFAVIEGKQDERIYA